jgi:hypothetical protein
LQVNLDGEVQVSENQDAYFGAAMRATHRPLLIEQAVGLGYSPARRLPNGEMAGVTPMLTTFALFVGLTARGWRTSYYYEHKADAEAALAAWDGAGDPPGPWIKQKPEERLGPGAVE